MRQPEIYTANQIRRWNVAAACNPPAVPEGEQYWIPARPMGHNLYPLKHRIKTAWLVFTGKADALIWDRP